MFDTCVYLKKVQQAAIEEKKFRNQMLDAKATGDAATKKQESLLNK